MVLAGAVLTRGLRLRVASLAVLIGGVIVARSSVPATLGLSDYVNRVGSIFSFNYQATSGRNILWSMGWDAFLAHPWLGLGIGNFLQAGYWYPLLFRQNGVPPGFAHTIQAVHNFYLGWAVDTGLAGVFFLALAVLVAFVYLMKVLAASRLHPELGTAAHALLLAFVGYFVFIISSPVQYYQLPYILLGLVGSVGFVAKDMRGARFGFRSTVARPESVLTGRPVPILRRRSLAPAPFGRTE
jgi:O-antigen ligase